MESILAVFSPQEWKILEMALGIARSETENGWYDYEALYKKLFVDESGWIKLEEGQVGIIEREEEYDHPE